MTTEYSLRMKIAHLREEISDYESDFKSLDKLLNDSMQREHELLERCKKLQDSLDKEKADHEKTNQDLCYLSDRHANLLEAYRQLYKKWWDSSYLATDDDELPF